MLLPLVSYFGTFCPKVPTRGGATTATTYIRPYKQAAGLSAVQTMEERFAYGLNPQKLGAVSSHLCDPATAAAEFLLVKSEYQAATARPVERGALFFQIRQAFPPGEVTAEEANKLGLWLSALISRPQDIVIVQQRLASGQKWHHGIACD